VQNRFPRVQSADDLPQLLSQWDWESVWVSVYRGRKSVFRVLSSFEGLVWRLFEGLLRAKGFVSVLLMICESKKVMLVREHVVVEAAKTVVSRVWVNCVSH
jgi:hypothetical protein